MSVVILRIESELPLSMREGRASATDVMLPTGVPVNEPARTSAATILLSPVPVKSPAACRQDGGVMP
jgi:hypothetical protein